MLQSGLYVVATPIGNLEDISHRALRVLTEADLVVAEDTRHSRPLLLHYGIQRSLQSLHEHNEAEKIPMLTAQIAAGRSVALISDAGTPLISDPGYRLVRETAALGFPVISVPGASAVTAALSVAGLPTDRFMFEGFLPARAVPRQSRLEALKAEPRTLVFFESSHRIEACLEGMAKAFGPDRRGAVCRELTKQFETVLRGTLEELAGIVAQDPNQRKGEFVVLVEGCTDAPAAVDGVELARQLLAFLPASQAARVAARVTGGDRRAIYEQLSSADGQSI